MPKHEKHMMPGSHLMKDKDMKKHMGGKMSPKGMAPKGHGNAAKKRKK